MTIKYKPLSLENLVAYRQIRLECLKNHPENFGSLYEDELHSKELKFDKIIAQNDGTDFLMGAFENGNLVGICGYIQEKRIKTKHSGDISHMYVKTEFGGKGIATQLLKKSIEQAFLDKEIEQITLGVVNSNEQALHVYRKIGFVQYGVLEKYYKYQNVYQSLVLMVLTRDL
jgi:RimJ/RimL family protein N-acetyltransferase